MQTANSVHSGTDTNSSGMGRDAVIPPEIRGWSWGAFLLCPFWGIGNSVYFALFALLLPIAIVIMIILGIKGREWAWRNRYWRSVEDFKRVQRRWAIAGFTLWVAIPLVFALVLTSMFSGPKQSALEAIRQNPTAIELLGEPIQAGWFLNGSVNIAPDAGCAVFSVSFSGSKASGSSNVIAAKAHSTWLVLKQNLIVNGTETIIVNRPNRDDYLGYLQPCL